MNALSCQSEEQLHQLVREMAEALDLSVNSPEAYLDELRLLAAITPAVGTPAPPKPDSPADVELTEDHLALIKCFARAEWKYAHAHSLAKEFHWTLTRVQHYFDVLHECGYLGVSYRESGAVYYLERRGRDFAVSRGFA